MENGAASYTSVANQHRAADPIYIGLWGVTIATLLLPAKLILQTKTKQRGKMHEVF